MNNLTEKILQGIVQTQLVGNFNSVTASLINSYPVIGIGAWNLEEADDIFKQLNLIEYIDNSFANLTNEQIKSLKKILNTPESKQIQLDKLTNEINLYLKEFNHIQNEKCLIYIIMWCVISFSSTYEFIKNKNINNFIELNEIFEKDFMIPYLRVSKQSRYIIRQKAKLIYKYIAGLN